MKATIFLLSLISTVFISAASCGQGTALIPGKTIERKILKGEKHQYMISLQKGDHAEFKVKQVSALLTIVSKDTLDKTVRVAKSQKPPDYDLSVSFEASKTGNFQLVFYPMAAPSGSPDSLKSAWVEENQGDYVISDIVRLSAKEYKQKLSQIQEDKDLFAQWIKNNAQEIKTVDAGNGFEDLRPFKTILKDVRVVGLGEATHGTSEFYRMKHRMLEFLVKEMGFTSFYIEAPMSRCHYINNYVINGTGDLDTAAVIHGYPSWRVEEVRNMIGWIRQYNVSVPESKKVKFFGIDLQASDDAWKELKQFYKQVNPQRIMELDSIEKQAQTTLIQARASLFLQTKEEMALFNDAYLRSLVIMDDIVLNEGKYRFLTGVNTYEGNLMNIKLIVQQLEERKVASYLGAGIRDKYMSDNVLSLLNKEAPDAKVVIWAHNGHIAKNPVSGVVKMGNHLAHILKTQYYSIGFEFYSGSFQARNSDINNQTQTWDVMQVGASPAESCAWYLNQAGKERFFIDFRNTGAGQIKNFAKTYPMHHIGAEFGKKYQATLQTSLTNYDGLIYIKETHAAKDFNKVKLGIYY